MADLFRYPAFDNFAFMENAKQKNGTVHALGYYMEGCSFKRDVFRIRLFKDDSTFKNHSMEHVHITPCDTVKITTTAKQTTFSSKSGYSYSLGGNPLTLKLRHQGKSLLASHPGLAGINGSRTAFAFKMEKGQPFWGFGEKTGNLNKSGTSLKMWNVDVMSDHSHSFSTDSYDPAYASIPFFVTKTAGEFVGFYLNNPCETFFDLGRSDPNLFYFGSYTGVSDLYIIPGTSIRDVLSKFHDLTGRMEMPPLWSLGYHQCRWSYMNEKEVEHVVAQYRKEKIPLSAIWLDIDYMDGYRVFTWNKKRFPDPKGLISKLRKEGINLVTIVDPGVKLEKKYPIYQQGKKEDLFCKTSNKQDYIGFVWPGKTVFPDFSLEKTQHWWASKIASFIKPGVAGIWIDMNDPSTGNSERDDMLFQNGSAEHQHYHNQYGTMMAKATKMGLEKAHPGKRTFILTRSASAGIQKYSAVWTGDNVSNWDHLRMSIPETLNLSLSGVSFNGPDVGGFVGNTNPKLITRWHQAGFLFPFMRNHSGLNTKNQEVYRFDKNHMGIMKKLINLRYKLLPYLYNQFFQHRVHSEPIIRPMFYEFDNKEYYGINDQFFVGSNILQAPIVSEKDERDILLPPGYWFDYFKNTWIKGGKKIKVKCVLSETKLYIRDGAIIPMMKDDEFPKSIPDINDGLEFHIYLHDQTKVSTYHYEDDGESNAYLKGMFNLYGMTASIENGKMEIKNKIIRKKFGDDKQERVFHIHHRGKTARKTMEM